MLKPHRSVLFASALSLSLVALTACASPVTSVDAQTETATSPTPPTVEARKVTDSDTCNAVSDVLTILNNAASSLNQGRATRTEYEAWVSLATRVLATVPIREDGDISDDVKELQSIAPPVPTGQGGSSPAASLEWTAGVDLAKHCEAAGHDLNIQGFVGG